jgi:hypothetical protein
MDRIIAKLKWEPKKELSEFPHHTEYEGKDIYALTRESNLCNAGYIITYIGLTTKNVINEMKIQSKDKSVSGFQIADVKIEKNDRLTTARLRLIETALIHYTREIHGWARMNRIQTGAPKNDIRIHNKGHKHPEFHKRFDIIEQEIKNKK